MRSRWYAAVLSLVLAIGLAGAVPRAAVADTAGPSVPLPPTSSVPVAQQGMAQVSSDQAASRALRGDQPAGAAPKDGGGTPVATSLSASATWSVSPQTGDFRWSYPLRVPPVPGGLAPNLALSYVSSAVDGRTSATNNQPSWAGDGWNLDPGFVERSYGPCGDDKEGGTVPPATGDLCWRSDNATATYNGGGGMLVRDDATGVWRPRGDDGSRVERFTGAGNGDDNGESWRITTVDGTQYFFGSRPDARSTWTVPVFGDDAGEPCHDVSSCPQAWRWNLDKVVDPQGNMMLLSYDAESNAYGWNMRDAAVSYIRGGTLRRIEYGLHTAVSGPAAGRVEFTVGDRCVPGSTCTLDRTENWPDTPLTERCDAATCHDHWSPTFWSTKRLSTVTTQVWRGSGYSDVDRWTLDHQFPDPGDGEKATLWLKSVTHTGLVGGSITLPAVTFQGVQMANRVMQGVDLSPVVRYRVTGIVSETGGVTSINYAAPNCVPGSSMPASPESNTLRCFPVTWFRPGYGQRTDWFHKYVVESVISSDRISSSLDQKVAYEYLDGAAWHFDTSEFTPADRRTYNEFRGFGRVRVRNGRSPDPGGPIRMTEQRFYRGMSGDRQRGTVTVADSEGGTRADEDWLTGFGFETTTFLGDSTDVVTRTVTEPLWQGPTATRGTFKAYVVRTGVQRTYTTLDSGRPRQLTRVETTYDDRGLPTAVNDLGDTGTAADDLCTRTTYVRNTAAWILSLPSRVETVAVRCGATPAFPDHAISDERTSYDDQAWNAAPRAGNVTRVEALDAHPAFGPVYITVSTTRYDAHGRPIETADALGRTSRTAYTPALGGPTTQVAATDPRGNTSTSVLEPASGQPLKATDANERVTEVAHDPLGRIVQVWQANRPRKTGFTPTQTFTYLIRRDEPSVVTTATIGSNGNYTTTNVLYDGQLRARQVQTPASGGGRLLTDKRYDSQGRAYRSTRPYFNDAPVDTTLWVAADVEVPGLTDSLFDGAGRPTASVFKAGGVEKWRTTITYGGDRVHITPPSGGTATATVTNVRGNTIERHQYHGTTPTGAADIARYTYTPAGQLASVRDPAGNTWRYAYDLHGRYVRADDPDKGVTTATYDAAGQLATQTDARGQLLAYAYDDLGRRTSVRAGGATGRPLARWTYDTVAYGKGKPATATSYDADGNAYTSEVLVYTALYQPRKTSLTVPDVEGPLAGTYVSYTGFKPDGSIAGETFPGVGGLFAETVGHTYDDSGRALTTYGGPDGSTITYASATDYTRYGETQRLHLGAGDKRTWLSTYYDGPTRRVERTIVDTEVPRPMQADVHYTYDPAGNVTSIADMPPDQPIDRQCFRYDYLRRLTEAWTPGNGCAAAPAAGALTGPAPYWRSFGYDMLGNRLSEVQHGAAGDTTRTYINPAPGGVRPHALSSVRTTGLAGDRTDTYAYDAAGNTTVRGGQQLTWDEQGHLATATETGQTTRFVYDTAGQRLIRRDPGATTLYLGGQELRLDRASGAVTGTRYYTHGGRVIAVRTTAGLTWLASDHHGTASVAIDATTMAATVRRSDPFGGHRGTQVAWPDDKGFVGGTKDTSTGLTHLGARDYDPATGRFISVDPILITGDPNQFHAYAYAANNPTTYSDPTGLFCDSCDYYAYMENTHSAWTPTVPKRNALGQTVNVPRPSRKPSKLNTCMIFTCPPSKKYGPHPVGTGPASTPTPAIAAIPPGPSRCDGRERCANPADADDTPTRADLCDGREHCANPAAHVDGPSGQQMRQAIVADEVKKLVPESLASPIVRISNGPSYNSGSFCYSTSASLIITVGVTSCLSWDTVGLTLNSKGKFGVEFGAGADASVILKLNTESAKQVNSGLEFVAEGGPKLIVGVGGGAKVEGEISVGGGSLNHSVQVEVGIGGRASLGGASFNAGINTGYLMRWCDMGLCG